MFEKKAYEWRIQMTKLLSNVALVEITIGGMNEASFDFLNTFNGQYLKTIVCKNVVKLQYETIGEDSFAYFVGEVYSKKLSFEETNEALEYFDVVFKRTDYGELILVSIEGGEIDIDVLCESVSTNRNALRRRSGC